MKNDPDTGQMIKLYASLAKAHHCFGHNQQGAAIKHTVLREYTRTYYEMHGHLPVGEHHVEVPSTSVNLSWYHPSREVLSCDALFPGPDIASKVESGQHVTYEDAWGPRPVPAPRIAPVRKPDDHFHPIEQAILYDWFGITRPDHLRNVLIDEDAYDDIEDGCFCVEYISNSSGNGYSLASAVARIILKPIQESLPQFMVTNSNGTTIYGRTIAPDNSPDSIPIPQLLLCINWADTAPGICWPEEYHLAHLPTFNRYVVTLSVDSNDVYGCTDLAIGHLPDTEAPLENACKCIQQWWKNRTEEGGQTRWAYVMEEGIISTEVAEAMADEINWPQVNDEDK